MDFERRHEPDFTPVKIEETSALVARDLAYGQVWAAQKLDLYLPAAQAARLIEETVQQPGRIDVLVNAARLLHGLPGEVFVLVTSSLEHYGDLPQIPSPQETQRHGFAYLVAAHNPLYICRFCHRLALSSNHDIQTLEFSMICWPTGAYLKQFHAKLLCDMQPLSQCRVDWHAQTTNP